MLIVSLESPLGQCGDSDMSMRNWWRAKPAWRRVIRIIRNVVGGIFIGVGLLGFIIPIFPGWPMIFVGIAVLGRKNPASIMVRRQLHRMNLFVHRLVSRTRRRHRLLRAHHHILPAPRHVDMARLVEHSSGLRRRIRLRRHHWSAGRDTSRPSDSWVRVPLKCWNANL